MNVKVKGSINTAVFQSQIPECPELESKRKYKYGSLPILRSHAFGGS